jgi:ribonuclease HI
MLTAFIDGGSRGNPGHAGAGIYFELDGTPWRGLFRYLGRQTNNYAEYTALLEALKYAMEFGHTSVQVFSDSELLVRQINGQYRVKNSVLIELYWKANELIRQLEKFSIKHVRREQNREADALANRAMDLAGSGEKIYE